MGTLKPISAPRRLSGCYENLVVDSLQVWLHDEPLTSTYGREARAQLCSEVFPPYTADGSLNRKLKPNHAQGSSGYMFEEDMTRRWATSAGRSCEIAHAAPLVALLPTRRRAYRACCFAILHHHGSVAMPSTSNQAGNAGAAAAGCVKKDVPRARSVSVRTLTQLLPWTKYVSELPREQLECLCEPSEVARADRACLLPWSEAGHAVTRPKDYHLTHERRVSKKHRSDPKRDEKLELRAARRKPLHAGHRSALLIAWRGQRMLRFERRVICECLVS